MAEEGISELEHMTIETSKTKTQKDRTEYPRTVEQLQKVKCVYNANTRSKRKKKTTEVLQQ